MRGEDLLDEHTYRRVRADQLVRERAKAAGLSRRRFLQILTAGAGAAAIGGVDPRAAERPFYRGIDLRGPAHLHVR